MNKGLYFTFLSIFILRVAFSALPYDSELIYWFKLYPDQGTTFQWAFWRLTILMVELFLIFSIMNASIENDQKMRLYNFRIAKILLFIQCWYIFEYCLHYTSVWITWEQLGFKGNGRSGLSSHVVTMIIFGYFGWSDD